MKPAVIFLEPKGTILEVVRTAVARGYAALCFSSDPNLILQAPIPYRSVATSIASIVQIDDWRDEAKFEKALEPLAQSYSIQGVYAGLDVCMTPGAKLRQRYNLPTPRPEVMQLVLDKFRLRKTLWEAGLSKLRAFSSDEVRSWNDWNFDSTAYFKPVQGAGSLYVKHCKNVADLRNALKNWECGNLADPSFIRQHMDANNDFFLEESFSGELMSVEAISDNGVFRPIGLTSRILYSKDPTVEMGSCFPYPHPLAEKIIGFVQRIHEVTEFTSGPSHTEVIVNQHGDVELIDFNPRFVGADVLQSINYAYGIHFEEVLLAYAIGAPINLNFSVKNYSCLQYVLPPMIDRLDSVVFPSDSAVKFSTVFLKPATLIRNRGRQVDYLACYLTVMPSFEKAISKSLQLRKQLVINDSVEGEY